MREYTIIDNNVKVMILRVLVGLLPLAVVHSQSSVTLVDEGGAFDYAWLWSWSVIREPEVTDRLVLTVPSAQSFIYLDQLGGQLALLRRNGKLHLPAGLWQERHLVSTINDLNSATSDEILALSTHFAEKGLAGYQGEFLARLFSDIEDYFDLSISQPLTDEQSVLALWQQVHWPTLWFDGAIVEQAETLVQAIEHLEVWQVLLREQGQQWREFFSQMTTEHLLGMAALIVEHWLYDELSPWPLDSREQALRTLYTLAASFYEMLSEQLTKHYHTLTEQAQLHLTNQPQDKELVEQYLALVRSNSKALLAIFYDRDEHKAFIQQRNALLFNNNAMKIAQHKQQVALLYQWLWASASERQMAYDRYWQAYED